MNIANKVDCTGCSACAAICHHLTMTMDDEGFRYPQLDPVGCNSCAQCRQICPMSADNNTEIRQHPGPVNMDTLAQSEYPQVFAAWNKNDAVRKESSSGGVFSLLANQVIAVGGLVVGAGFTDDLQLRHILVDKIESLQILRGSKYLQSDLGDVIIHIKTALVEGRQVFFTGTPCQVAGLKSYLKCEYDGLMTCDLVCHGVPSEKLFRKYIKESEGQHGGKAVAVSFRSKKAGWKRFSVKIDFDNGCVSEIPLDQDSFMRLFLADLCLRPSCYHCPFATIPRQGDISLADYWGVAPAHPGIDDDRGVSLILVNTEKGADMFNRVEGDMIVHPSDLARAVACNPCVIRPVHLNHERQDFMFDVDRLTLDQLIKKYIRQPSWIRRRYSASRRLLSNIKKSAICFLNPKSTGDVVKS